MDPQDVLRRAVRGYCRWCHSANTVESRLRIKPPRFEKSEPFDDMGTYDDLVTAARYCKFCAFLLAVVQVDTRNSGRVPAAHHELSLRYPRNAWGTQGAPSKIPYLTLQLHTGTEDITVATILPLPTRDKDLMPSFPLRSSRLRRGVYTDEESFELMPRARLLESKVNIPLLQYWLQLCCTSTAHDECKADDWSERGQLQRRFVDVKQRCIVEPATVPEYIALSYVWGVSKRFTLNSRNIKQLLEVGGLSAFEKDLPNTFKDAIKLTEDLGYRYVWIDAMCINQDDPDDTKHQMASMDQIYSCAQLTIVNNLEHADTGIPGVQSCPRNIKQVVYHSGPNTWTNTRPNIDEAMKDSPWEARGWTLQEMVFSHRVLLFTQSQVFYRCKRSTWYEDVALEISNLDLKQTWASQKKVAITQTLAENPRKAIIHLYEIWLKTYLSRQLSHMSDNVNAFAGILSSLGCGNICGLPEPVFRETLTWQYNYHNPNERIPLFPSWSWAGWQRQTYTFRPTGSTPYTDLFHPAWYRLERDPENPEQIHHVRIADEEQSNFDCLPPHTESGEKMEPFEYTEGSMPPLSHIIRGWTRVVRLYIEREPSDLPKHSNGHSYTVRFSQGHADDLGSIYLDPDWRKGQPDVMDFVVLVKNTSREEVPRMLLLVEWSEHKIASRVQLLRVLHTSPSQRGPILTRAPPLWNGWDELEWKLVAIA